MDTQMTVAHAANELAARPVPEAGWSVSPLLSALVLFALLATGAWWAWKAQSVKWAAGLGAGAALFGTSAAKQLTWAMVLPVLAAAGVAVMVGGWWWSRSESVVTRWGNRARRKSGVASSLDIARKASPAAARRRARVVRPSLGELSWRALRRIAPTEYAVMLCRVGRQWVCSTAEVVVLVFGSPRKGKSAMLAGTVIGAPGAAVVTSTKLDLLRATRELRARRGPVYVFNPGGEGGADAASTIAFDPRVGCTYPVAATERATDMIAAGGDGGAGGAAGDRAYWDGQARRVLAALLHAAALGDRPMTDVQKWAADPDEHGDQLTELLRNSPEPAFVADVRQFLATNERTRTSITSSIMPALAWLTHPAAATAANAGREGGALPVLDVAGLVATRGTVYLLGGEEAHVAPLVCALTGYIAREARRLAALAPGERLDPQLTLVLDEAAQICPVPLDRWSADMGGRGVCIVAGFQSRAQLLARYGVARAAVILNNAGSKVLFGGTSDRDDLQWWSTLAGERDELVPTTGPDGRTSARSLRKVPVVAPAELVRLTEHQVVVFAPGIPPVIGWAERYWRRPDIRALRQPNAVDVRWRAWRARTGAAARIWAAALVDRWARRPLGRARARAVGWLATQVAARRARRADPVSIGDPLAAGRVVPGEVVTSEVLDDQGPASAAEPMAEQGGANGAQVIPFPDRERTVDQPRRGDRPSPSPRRPAVGGPGEGSGDPDPAGDVWAGPDPRWWDRDDRR